MACDPLLRSGGAGEARDNTVVKNVPGITFVDRERRHNQIRNIDPLKK